jgi:hypothetical protein
MKLSSQLNISICFILYTVILLYLVKGKELFKLTQKTEKHNHDNLGEHHHHLQVCDNEQ